MCFRFILLIAVQTVFFLSLLASDLFSPSFPRLFAGERGPGGECFRPAISSIFMMNNPG